VATPEHDIFWREWLAAITSVIATIATGLTGWMFSRYVKDRERLTTVETRADKADLRMDTIAEGLESVIERQDEMHGTQEDMRNDVTEIKTDVKWIRKAMDE